MRTKITFEEHLRKSNLSENTIASYLWTVEYYNNHYDVISKENLLAYKGYLMEFFKPKTVNLRIQGINKYLDFLGKEKLQLKAVKIQQKNFLENVISNADYNFLKTPFHYCSCVKCGLDQGVVYLINHGKPLSFEQTIMYNFLKKHNLDNPNQINSNIKCDFSLAIVLYKKIEENHPDIDNITMQKYIQTALDSIRQNENDTQEKENRIKRLTLNPNFNN